MLRHQILLTIALTAILAPSLRASEFDWVEGEDGATRDYYNRAAQLKWRNFLGDWTDAAGKEQGDKPFGSATTDRSANNPLSPHLRSPQRRPQFPHLKSKFLKLPTLVEAGVGSVNADWKLDAWESELKEPLWGPGS
jgi:hypothetical protein